jgi:diaminopropionate ammonia-lyase
MHVYANPFRGPGLPDPPAPYPSVNAGAVQALLAQCPAARATPLVKATGLAERANVAEVWVKDERGRMGLGSFKALGAAYVIARDAATGDVSTRTYVAASAGNHGMSVAAGARVFGAKSVIYLAQTVPAGFAQRLRDKGADVVIEGADYAASMTAAAKAAADKGWTLLSDGSWPGYIDIPFHVMEGYTQLAAEICDDLTPAPSHILLQAGVGGLAGAVAAVARARWGDAPKIIVVEPEAAPALIDSIKAGHAVHTTGPVSNMGRLDCKDPSLIALTGLARDADLFVTISDAEAEAAMPVLAAAGLATSPSGGAGLAALLAGLDLPTDARVLCILSEGPAG